MKMAISAAATRIETRDSVRVERSNGDCSATRQHDNSRTAAFEYDERMCKMVLRFRTGMMFRAALSAAWVCGAVACGSSPSAPLTGAQNAAGGSPGTISTLPTAGTAHTVAAGSTGGLIAVAGSHALPTAGSATGAGGAGATTTAPGTTAPGATAPALPCMVSQVLATNCQSCHGATPIGGAPMSLVTYADLQKPAVTMPSMKVYELAKVRLNDKARPMPPGGSIAAADFSALDTWLGAGAQPAPASEGMATCMAASAPPITGDGTADGSYGPILPAPGETCYEFKTHNSTTAVDDTAYDVGGNGEHYEQFYFKAPWPDGTQATRYGTKLDNTKVLHHWLLFQTSEDEVDGFHKTSPLPTLNGVDAMLLSGWAVGGTNLAMPPDVGFELPKKGTQLNLQWHFYNSTGTDQSDKSSVQICTVPPATRPHTATITWTGTEDLNGNKWLGGAGMPAHMTSTFGGTCDPLREGMNDTDPIHIIAFWPHMHKLGVNMSSTVNHKDGTKEVIFDKPFDFNHQVHYLQNYDLQKGDTLSNICTFNNTTDMGVPFGESSDTEMCYQFTFAWPAHSLENHVVSLIGATNTCWQ
jgi:Copper type II ascorbate-dependent monooxygenase, C-terminal domain